MFDPRTHCGWCWASPSMDQCKCTKPCGKACCPMIDDGLLYTPTQPIPQFEESE